MQLSTLKLRKKLDFYCLKKLESAEGLENELNEMYLLSSAKSLELNLESVKVTPELKSREFCKYFGT